MASLRNRTPELIDGDYWYVLLGQREAHDRTYIKSYSNSSAYTPDIYPDDTVFEVADGQILPTTVGAGGQVQVINVQDTAGSSMEVGMVTMDWTVGDPWVDVSFVNTYSTAPVVVAKPLTYEGSHESITRVQNVTSTGFQIRIQEWDYRDGNHTTETLFYVVADTGAYDVPLAGGSNLRVDAGKLSAMSTMCFSGNQHQAIGPFLSNPVVFTGLSTFNEADAVVTRNHNVSTGGFDVCLQEQKTKNTAGEAHAAEDIHYVAVAPGNAAATLPVSGLTVSTSNQVELGDSGGDNMSEAWRTITFASTFGEAPAVVMDMQTLNGSDPATLRVADKKWSQTQIDARVEEENSDGSGQSHPALERVGYLAVGGVGVYNIHLALKETDTVAKPNEPKGLLQALDGKMRLGLAVFNYDHNLDPTSITSTSGRNFDGGTFYPCYPDRLKATSELTTWDICLETGVKAPLSNMVEVIEDHPLVWATTPIAETLYNIGQYVAQGEYDANGDDSPDAGPLNGVPWPVSESRQGYPTAPSPDHSPLYANNDGSTAHPNTGAHPPFQVNNSWDPYYYN